MTRPITAHYIPLKVTLSKIFSILHMLELALNYMKKVNKSLSEDVKDGS